MPKSRSPGSAVKTTSSRSLMVRLDDESKNSLFQAAKLRGISLSDYVRTVTVPQARRELLAAREQTLAMTPAEQLKFWNALVGPSTLTESQKRLGALMRGEG